MGSTLSASAIDRALWTIHSRIMRREGVDAAARRLSPVVWYVNTGRASTAFLKEFIAADPRKIEKVLCAGGSDEEIVRKLKKALLPDGGEAQEQNSPKNNT